MGHKKKNTLHYSMVDIGEAMQCSTKTVRRRAIKDRVNIRWMSLLELARWIISYVDVDLNTENDEK